MRGGAAEEAAAAELDGIRLDVGGAGQLARRRQPAVIVRHVRQQTEQQPGRRRQAIIDAARRLFAERGYFAAKVDDIAAEARVAPATVYAVTGGKQNLLDILITAWTTDPIVEQTLGHIDTSTDSVAIIREVASASRTMREASALLSPAGHAGQR
jgi:AcrR family transcriptional regulator